MSKSTSEKRQKKLLEYKTKNEMVPTFVSGVFLSGAINILTSDNSRASFFYMVSMALMFLSCLLFFFLAAKIHELQTWYSSLPDENKTDRKFLDGTTAWDWGTRKDFFKNIIIPIPFTAWALGIVGLLIYLWGEDAWKGICWLFALICK